MSTASLYSNYFIFTFIFLFLLFKITGVEDNDHYIVYLGSKRNQPNLVSTHQALLQSLFDCQSNLVYSYTRSFDAFVAKLSPKEASAISEHKDVVSVFQNRKLELQTTRSWDFLGITSQAKRNTYESDIIVGVVDTGIWPELESFSDHELGPPPSRWKGVCQNSNNFTCNNKIIGARYYSVLDNDFSHQDGFISPRDGDGHGSHTASTAAGVATTASFYGIASGTARGAVPAARLAIYKACSAVGCSIVNLLAAMDDAIADGVDIISASISARTQFPKPDVFEFLIDPVAIGSYHAMQHGILTVAAASNGGPRSKSLGNVAPWIFTVGASTIDRKFTTTIDFEDGQSYQGASVNTFAMESFAPLIIIERCNDTDNTEKLRSKIVVCELGRPKNNFLISSGAAGYITPSGCDVDVADVTPIPGACLLKDVLDRIVSNIRRNSTSLARINKSTENYDVAAPRVAIFSSRGPNIINPDILKPDVTAPGVSILAAWTVGNSPTEEKSDHLVSKFNIVSGTSMSCPHVTGISAYVKEFNPSFSPAAIRSAIMTTGSYSQRSSGGEYVYGSGHVDPVKAIDPGLIYDISSPDYIAFLCSHNYTTEKLQLLTGDISSCQGITTMSLNYPSITFVGYNLSVSGEQSRTVTNVGSAPSTYKVEIRGAPSLSIHVEPEVLFFTYLGQKLSYTVRINANLGAAAPNSSPPLAGSIVWQDGVHKVRSPIVVSRHPSLS